MVLRQELAERKRQEAFQLEWSSAISGEGKGEAESCSGSASRRDRKVSVAYLCRGLFPGFFKPKSRRGNLGNELSIEFKSQEIARIQAELAKKRSAIRLFHLFGGKRRPSDWRVVKVGQDVFACVRHRKFQIRPRHLLQGSISSFRGSCDSGGRAQAVLPSSQHVALNALRSGAKGAPPQRPTACPAQCVARVRSKEVALARRRAKRGSGGP